VVGGDVHIAPMSGDLATEPFLVRGDVDIRDDVDIVPYNELKHFSRENLSMSFHVKSVILGMFSVAVVYTDSTWSFIRTMRGSIEKEVIKHT
jgi:hypothetical protein